MDSQNPKSQRPPLIPPKFPGAAACAAACADDIVVSFFFIQLMLHSGGALTDSQLLPQLH